MLADKKHVQINDDVYDLLDDLISILKIENKFLHRKNLTRCRASSLSNANIAKTAKIRKTTPRILDVRPCCCVLSDDENNT